MKEIENTSSKSMLTNNLDVMTQARSFLDKLNRNQKFILGGVSAIILAGIIAIIVANIKPTETAVLFSDLEFSDLSKITEYLKANKIDYQLVNSSTILVPKNRVDDIRMAVATQDLIKDSNIGYELFDKTNLGMSEYVQQLNGRRALEGELQKTIKSMDEVKDVSVRLTLPKKALFKSQEIQPTAAVKLRLKSSRSLNRLSIEGIQNLVASSVEGLEPANVVVTDNNGRMLSEPQLDEKSVAGITSAQLKQQKDIENYLADKVQSLLDPAFGPENTKVRLNTDIDFDQLQVNKTDWDPERQVERSEQSISDNLRNIDTSFVPGVNETQERLNEIRNYEITRADSMFIKSVGAIKRLTVTAIVNEKVEVQRIPNTVRDTVVSIPRTQEELDRIVDAIKTTVGFNEQRGDQVNILCVPFVELLADKITEVNERNFINSIQWYEKEETQRLLLLLLTLLITALVMVRILHFKFAKNKMRIAMGLPAKLDQPKIDKFDSSLLAIPQEEEDYDEDDEEDDEEEPILLEEETPVEEEAEEDEEELWQEEEEELVVEELLEDIDDELDEMEIDESTAMLIPDELPEHLFFNEGLLEEMDIISDTEDELLDYEKTGLEADALLARARAALARDETETVEDISEDELIRMELRDRITAFIVNSPDLALKIFRIFYHQNEEQA